MPVHVTVSLTGGVVNTAGGAGVTVMVLVTGVSALPQASVAVQVSVIVPPHGPGGSRECGGIGSTRDQAGTGKSIGIGQR